MKTCTKCILNEHYSHLSFDENGVCSLCQTPKKFTPKGEDKLIRIFEEVKSKNAKYDALVPLSGGKDSTYLLHLAVNVYHLNVLTMTYDNGFASPIALENIKRAVDITGVKHLVCKSDEDVQRRIYQAMLLLSGDLCGACGIAMKMNIFKVAKEYHIPIVLLGTSPLENDSFLPDSTLDVKRCRYILTKSNLLSKKEIDDFLVYPDLDMFKLSLYKRIGKFPKEILPLFYFDNPSDKEMGTVIAKYLDWKEIENKEYTKHFDCTAEPLTNYFRQKIYGYDRRICQYSTMVRRGEISREKALALHEADHVEDLPSNYKDVLEKLGLSEADLSIIISNQPLKYETYTSKMNRIFTLLMKCMK